MCVKILIYASSELRSILSHVKKKKSKKKNQRAGEELDGPFLKWETTDGLYGTSVSLSVQGRSQQNRKHTHTSTHRHTRAHTQLIVPTDATRNSGWATPHRSTKEQNDCEINWWMNRWERAHSPSYHMLSNITNSTPIILQLIICVLICCFTEPVWKTT